MLIKRKIINKYVDKGQFISKDAFTDAIYRATITDHVGRRNIVDVLTDAASDEGGLIADFVAPDARGMTVWAPSPESGIEKRYNLYDADDLYWMVASLWVIQYKKRLPKPYRNIKNFDISIDIWYRPAAKVEDRPVLCPACQRPFPALAPIDDVPEGHCPVCGRPRKDTV